jgi:hypothetical protein
MKPNFLVIGAAKAATTSVCDLLGQHPDVFMSEPKEPRFFSMDSVYERGWEWYESLFENSGNCSAVGEGSTSYSMVGVHTNTVARIVRHLETPRIIYCVREPFSRVESGWMESRHSANPLALPSFPQSLRESPNFLDESLYWKQISAYRQVTPDERILIIFFEDFARDPRATLRRCFEFLEVDADHEVVDANRRRRSTVGYRRDRWAMSALRRVPLAGRASRLVSPRLRSAVLGVLRAPLSGRPQWDEETRRWFADQIADDIRAFLEFCGKPRDYWNLDMPDEE